MNWAPIAVYNPQLWHWPEDWPLVRLSPTVEPFVVIGYATFYFGPFFPAIAILRRLQARATAEAFVWRRPLVSLAVLLLAIGFVFDAILEIFLVRTGLYIYSQVMPWGSLFAGTTFQFPLIWESALVTVVMIPAGVLCYRDDTGRTQAEKLARRFRWFPARPALGTFVMMFAILNVAYFIYGGAFATIRAAKLATSVACPWPYPEAKVYDPLRKRGPTRPLLRGTLEHVDERPAVGTPVGEPARGRRELPAGRCVSRGASSSRVRRAGSASRPPPTCTRGDGASSERCARPARASNACGRRPVPAATIRACSASGSTSKTRRRFSLPPRRSRERSARRTSSCTTRASPP
jgi:hypothetical protein